MEFLQASSWMRSHLPRYAEVKIVYIAGGLNCSSDISLRLRTLAPDAPEGPGPVCSAALSTVPDADYSLPTKNARKDR